MHFMIPTGLYPKSWRQIHLKIFRKAHGLCAQSREKSFATSNTELTSKMRAWLTAGSVKLNQFSNSPIWMDQLIVI
jgi:hypothetical protein